MSLLMDALKKAEEAKRLAEGTSIPTGDRMPDRGRLEPRSEPAQSASLPELPATLALLDDQFANVTGSHAESSRQTARATAASPAEEPDRQEQERQAVQQVFAAKQTPSQRPFYLGLAAATAVAVVAIGAYFWWQLRPKSSAIVPVADRAAILPAVPPPPPATTATDRSVPTPPQPTRAGTVGVAPVGGEAPNPAAAGGGYRIAEDPRHPAANRSETRTRPAASTASVVKGELSDPESNATATDMPIRVSRGKLQVDPGVARGYRQFLSGNLSAARSDYEQVLRNDPRNTDALDGMAAISLSQGQAEAAESYYRRALEVDPKDATAQAGLINLLGSADPLQAESRLKILAASQPEAHAALFALGNLYASQDRWRDAQQAYFRAYTADADNPDYQFNLAVSLDHLRQSRLALQYYQSALTAVAAGRPASFDRNQAAARVRELQQ